MLVRDIITRDGNSQSARSGVLQKLIVKKFPAFIKSECSFSHFSKNKLINFTPKYNFLLSSILILSFHLRPSLPSSLFPSDVTTIKCAISDSLTFSLYLYLTKTADYEVVFSSLTTGPRIILSSFLLFHCHLLIVLFLVL